MKDLWPISIISSILLALLNGCHQRLWYSWC